MTPMELPLTIPTPLSMDMVSAPQVDQDRVVDWPITTAAGDAVKLSICGSAGGMTSVKVPLVTALLARPDPTASALTVAVFGSENGAV